MRASRKAYGSNSFFQRHIKILYHQQIFLANASQVQDLSPDGGKLSPEAFSNKVARLIAAQMTPVESSISEVEQEKDTDSKISKLAEKLFMVSVVFVNFKFLAYVKWCDDTKASLPHFFRAN